MSVVYTLKEFVNQRLTATVEEIFRVFEKTIVEYEEEIDRQRRLLDVVCKPDIKLHKLERQQQRVCKEEEKEEEDVADQQLCIQERSSSLDQEDPDPPQIKEEQEELCAGEGGEQLVLKQETDAFMLTCEDIETQALDSSISVVEEKPLSYIIIKSFVASEPNRDQQLLSHISQEAKRQDQKGGKPGDSASSRDAEPQQHSHTSSSLTYSVYNPTMSMIQCSTRAGKKPFKCDKCEKAFKYNSLLQRHLVKHTGEKPHVCKTCGKRFTDISSMRRHMRSHTRETKCTCKT